MHIDISSHQGRIDWAKVANNKDITGVILRSTTKNGSLDVRTMENYNGILQNIISRLDELSVYKFSYARDYAGARIEATKVLTALQSTGIHYDYLYLDMELFDGREYTKRETSEVIFGYFDTMIKWRCTEKLRIYTNYNYLRNILDRDVAGPFPIWLAKWSDNIGDISGYKVKLWQYTNSGQISGINGPVDLSRAI